jgi:hypothetical protein
MSNVQLKSSSSCLRIFFNIVKYVLDRGRISMIKVTLVQFHRKPKSTKKKTVHSQNTTDICQRRHHPFSALSSFIKKL